MNNKTVRASYTVEAVMIYPFIIILLAFFISTGIKLYEGVRTDADHAVEVCKVDSNRIFELHHLIEKVEAGK